MDFFVDDKRNMSSQIADTFTALNSVDSSNIFSAKQIAQDLQKYIQETMLPKLLKLEVILLVNAYIVKSKPICDLFYCFDELSKQRVLRDSKEFYNLIAGGFMVLYYKVGNITLLKYKF